MSLDNYEKKAVVGKGSYGEVWLARHKYDKKQYVLKKMDLRNASKRERLAAEQEARLLFDMKHPNIVAYRDSFEADSGFLYIVMGYCEGGDLYTRLKQQKNVPLEERQIVEWFVQIAMALQYMHEKKILHRDLKTQNIFLTKSKIIKVGDLGIARVLESSSDMATTLIGTPYYMSPELFSNKPYSFKSDVWALGCCVYEMTTLKHAFNAKDMNSLMYKVLRGKMPPMPDIYRVELMNLIKAMLQTNPDKRPSVGRILRDPYIKQNIAIFLEGTKKRAQQSDSRPGTGERKSGGTRQSVDSGISRHQQSSSPQVRSRDGKVEESLEPLHIGPDLEPIREEATPRDSISVSDVSSKINSGKKSVGSENVLSQVPGRQRSQSGGDFQLVDSVNDSAHPEYNGRPVASKQPEIFVIKSSTSSSKISSSSSSSSSNCRESGSENNVIKDQKPSQQRQEELSSHEEQKQEQQKSERKMEKLEQDSKKSVRDKLSGELRSSADSVDGAKRRERRREKIARNSSEKLPRALPLCKSDQNVNSSEGFSGGNRQEQRNQENSSCIVKHVSSCSNISERNYAQEKRNKDEIDVNRANSRSDLRKDGVASNVPSAVNNHSEIPERDNTGNNLRYKSVGVETKISEHVREQVTDNRKDYWPNNYKDSGISVENGFDDSIEERNSRNDRSRYADVDISPVKESYREKSAHVSHSNDRTPVGRPLPVPCPRQIKGSSGSRSSTDSSSMGSRPPLEPKSGSSPASCSRSSDPDQRKRSTSRKSRSRNSQEDDFCAEKSSYVESRNGNSDRGEFHAGKSHHVEAKDRLGWEDVESGYASVTNSVNESKDGGGDRGWHTPRASFDAAASKQMSTGARARRRAERESQTPRSHTSIDLAAMARHCDQVDSSVDDKRHHLSASSADNNIHRSKSSNFERLENEGQLRSINGAGDRWMEEKRKNSQSTLREHDDDNDDGKEEEVSNECRRSSSSDASSVDAEDSSVREIRRTDREMNSFITLLDTTLHMQRHRSPRDDDVSQCNDNDDNEDDDELEIVEEAVIKPSVSTICDLTFVKPRPSRLPAGSNYPVIGQERNPEAGPVERVEHNEGGRDVGISMTSTGRLWERIVILRKDCIRNIGMEKLYRAYEILDNFDSEELEPRLIELLGMENFEAYAGKIWQLKFCEESAYTGCS